MILKAERLNNDLMAQSGSFTHTVALSVCLHVTPDAPVIVVNKTKKNKERKRKAFLSP